MDKSCSDSINHYFGLTNDSEYLPIPVMGIETKTPDNLKSLIKKRDRDVVSLSYIGRAEIWKINPVKKIVSDLQAGMSLNNKKIRFHIFTDNVEEFKRLLAYNSSDVEIIYHLNVSGSDLDLFLKNEVLLNLSMGTSCLESAKLGIPSILLDSSFDEFPQNYKYNWIFTTEHFSLGKIVDKNYIPTTGYTLADILNRMLGDEFFISEISDKCLEYTLLNHNIETVTSLFIEKTNLCKNKITPSIKELFFENLF